ncbi:uncharacterized protein LOC128599329 isoform X2 [Ictalurus furcatus]|uniref:uncharacterized protein LOC128599329 isoform X2 n=1 Tax=Ictalurus furcatus TaxID=66913 RepID=UPI0023500F2C|nr:uncharacterized protein LOC128599329 isoform X2 [Ictalurus furcatus]
MDNVDPICMKPDSPMIQQTVTTETTTLASSLVLSDVMEESEKSMLPTLLKEPALDSSEITAQSKLTPTGSGLGSQMSLQATPAVAGELQTSLAGPSQTLETLHDSSESKEDTQESAMVSSEIKLRLQGSAEVKEDSQEEVSVQSSASISSEHGIRPPRRSKFLKPKPNLNQKSRAPVLQNQRQDLETASTLKPKSSKPTVSTEKLHDSPATDQHGALEDFIKENLTKEEETSRSNAVNQMESESTKDLGDPSTVPVQENITTVTLSAVSADEPQVASECSSSRCDVDMIPPCTSFTSPQPSQTGEDTGAGPMIVLSEDACAPAEIVHLREDGHSDEEPTFILTFYEIPVTQAYLPSSSNDSAMISDLPTVETQVSLGFSDQAHPLPSTSESSSITAVPQDPEDTEQCERVSHMVMADVFVPVSEEMGDDSSQDSMMAVELKLHSKEASTVSLPERRDTPYEELTQVLFVF